MLNAEIINVFGLYDKFPICHIDNKYIFKHDINRYSYANTLNTKRKKL
jgi:hypothetical protein